jgi:trk system potassium uptake protein TrkA
VFILIAGGEPVGSQLAKFLIAQNHQVRLIENSPTVLADIHHRLPTEVIVEGSVTDLKLLELAGIQQANVLVACTPNDTDNLALCFLAQTLYKVPRTIGRINDPSHAWLFDHKFHVDVAMNEATILAHLIEEELSLGEMMTLLKLRRGKYSLVEVYINKKAKVVGAAIKDIALPEHCNIAAIIREGELIVPRGATSLNAGDEVLAVTDAEGAEQLASLFSA